MRNKVAMSLWKLATNVEYRTIGELFGVGKSTVCEIFLDFIHIVSTEVTVAKKYIIWPKGSAYS